MRNEVVLDGIVLRVGEVRYSPAGIPLMQLLVGHDAVHEQAGHPRRVSFRVLVTAAGESLEAGISRLRKGDRIRVRGMLARKGYRSEDTQLVIQAHEVALRDERANEDIERG